MLTSMLEALIIRFGYVVIAGGAFLEGEAVLVAAGALAHKGLLSLPLVMLAAFVGSVVGDQVWFQLGKRFGPGLLEKRPAWKPRVAVVQERLAKWGTAFVFGFRFIIGLRTITPALLGVSGYPVVRFVVLNVLGAAIWAVAIGGAGWGLGATLTVLLDRAAHIEELVVGIAVVAVGIAFVWRWRRRRTASSATAQQVE